MMWKASIENNSVFDSPEASLSCYYLTWSVILRFNGSPPIRSNWINAIRNAFPGTEIRNNRLPTIIISDMLNFESSKLNSIWEEFISQIWKNVLTQKQPRKTGKLLRAEQQLFCKYDDFLLEKITAIAACCYSSNNSHNNFRVKLLDYIFQRC